MPITTDQVLSDTVPTILERARFTSQFKAIMASLSWKITKQLHDGKNVNLPYWGIVAAGNLTEGVDMSTSEAMEDTLITYTPGEVGVKIILTDKLVRDNNEDVKAAAGRILGDAMELKRDVDLLNQLDDGAETLGSGSGATLGQFAAARAILMGNAVSTGGPAPLPYACVTHPHVTLDLVDVLTPILPSSNYGMVGAAGIADQVTRQYTIGTLFGMPIVEDGNLPISSNTVKGGCFATGEGGGLVLATADEWAIEPERDASLRATELNIVGEYAVGEYLANWIVELYHDAATPS